MGETTQGGIAGVLAAARATPGMRVIHVSSVLAVGSTHTPELIDETFPYRLDADKRLVHSHHKHRAELLCRQAVEDGLDVVIVNPTEVYGPNDIGLITASNLVDFAKSNPVLVCHGGTSVVHVEDVARGILAHSITVAEASVTSWVAKTLPTGNWPNCSSNCRVRKSG